VYPAGHKQKASEIVPLCFCRIIQPACGAADVDVSRTTCGVCNYYIFYLQQCISEQLRFPADAIIAKQNKIPS